MNFRTASLFLALTALPIHAGDSPAAKDAIQPTAKETLPPLDPDALSSKDAKNILPPPPAPSRWTLGAGVAWRKIGFVEFDTAVTRLTPPGLYGSSSFTAPPGIGPATGFAERDYDDGFVYPGPRVNATGRTTDYGYDNPGQLQGDNLVYMAGGGERRIVEAMQSTASADWYESSDWEVSPYLKLSRLTGLGDGWSAGPAIHFNLTSVDAGRRGLQTLSAGERLDVYDVTATDTYDSSGLVLPQAPYTGSPGAVAPLLPAEPQSRVFTDTLRSSELAVFHDSIDEDLDLNLFGLSVGGEALYQFNDRFFGTLGTGLVVNVADWDATRRDRLLLSTDGGAPVEIDSRTRNSSGTDLLLGFYLQGSLGYQLSEAFAIEASARGDWNQRLDDSVGDSDFKAELTGFSLGIGCRYSF